MNAEQKLTGFGQFIFYKLDQAWHRQPDDRREEGIRQFVTAAEKTADGLEVKAFSTIGLRADTDFFLWNRAASLEALQAFASRLGRTGLGRYLQTPHLYVSLYRESPYQKLKDHEPPDIQDPKFLFVYPFLKNRQWYHLPMEERGRMMKEHIAVGHKFESVNINTSYSFGLGDQEFVIAFDTNHPADFEALVRRLRETDASLYTLRDTPIFVGTAGSPEEVVRQFA